MNMQNLQGIVDFLGKVVGEVIPLVQAGVDVTHILVNAKERADAMAAAGRGPTAEEWEALDAQLKPAQDELHDRGPSASGG